MKKFFRFGKSPLIIGAISIFLLVFISSSLDSLEFHKGKPFSPVMTTEASNTAMRLSDAKWLVYLSIGIYIAIIFLVLYFAPPKQRRSIILALLAIALVFLGIMWWMSIERPGQEGAEPTPTLQHTSVPEIENNLPAEEQSGETVFEQPVVSPWVSIGITFFVMLVATILIWYFLYKKRRKNVFPYQELAELVEKTVNDLQTGRDYGDTVINCYANMILLLSRKRGIQKRGDLTPSEFIAVLERANLPSKAVRQLTVLFEKVRYGGKISSDEERNAAIYFLNEIVSAIKVNQ